MLIKLKFRFPDIVLGAMLAVAFFAIGVGFSSQHQENKAAIENSSYEKPNQKSLGASSDSLILGWPALDVFTGVLAFATIGLGIISICGIRNQLRETRILQRAYVSAEPGGVSPFLPSDLTASPTNKTLVGHVGFRNAGRLPARNVRWYIDAEYSIEPKYEPIRFSELTGGNNVISPGIVMTQGSIEKDIPESRRGYFYVWGKIVYHDGFRTDRETVFCHRYNCRRLEQGEDGFLRIRRRYGRHHDKGNDAT